MAVGQCWWHRFCLLPSCVRSQNFKSYPTEDYQSKVSKLRFFDPFRAYSSPAFLSHIPQNGVATTIRSLATAALERPYRRQKCTHQTRPYHIHLAVYLTHQLHGLRCRKRRRRRGAVCDGHAFFAAPGILEQQSSIVNPTILLQSHTLRFVCKIPLALHPAGQNQFRAPPPPP